MRISLPAGEYRPVDTPESREKVARICAEMNAKVAEQYRIAKEARKDSWHHGPCLPLYKFIRQ